MKDALKRRRLSSFEKIPSIDTALLSRASVFLLSFCCCAILFYSPRIAKKNGNLTIREEPVIIKRAGARQSDTRESNYSGSSKLWKSNCKYPRYFFEAKCDLSAIRRVCEKRAFEESAANETNGFRRRLALRAPTLANSCLDCMRINTYTRRRHNNS